MGGFAFAKDKGEVWGWETRQPNKWKEGEGIGDGGDSGGVSEQGKDDGEKNRVSGSQGIEEHA